MYIIYITCVADCVPIFWFYFLKKEKGEQLEKHKKRNNVGQSGIVVGHLRVIVMWLNGVRCFRDARPNFGYAY